MIPLRFTICRVGELPPPDYDTRAPLDAPPSVVQFWRSVISTQPDHEPDKENLVAILLDAKLRPKGYHLVALGSLNECIAHPREIFRPAIICGAYGFVLAHNHPSGDPAPSEADRRLTRRLQEASELLQIRVLDHVVIGEAEKDTPRYFSFREEGLL